MKIYRSPKDKLILNLIIAFMLLPVMVFVIDRGYFAENPFALLPLLLPLILILWVYFDTYYIIDGQNLKYHSAFLRGEIDIMKIREIVKGKTVWVGIKPALARKGLTIKFNRFDEIYISPAFNDDMISELIKINPDIKVVFF
jgi:hypothetical protein